MDKNELRELIIWLEDRIIFSGNKENESKDIFDRRYWYGRMQGYKETLTAIQDSVYPPTNE